MTHPNRDAGSLLTPPPNLSNVRQVPQTMTVREAAKALGTTTRTVHRMIARGELDARKAYAGLRAPYLITRASVEQSAENYPRAS